MPTVVANRYARALADVVAPTGNYRQVLSELEDFGAAYRAEPGAARSLRNPCRQHGAEIKRAGSPGGENGQLARHA